MQEPDHFWPKTFKEAFCERFRCPPEQYEQMLFRRCLYRHALPLAPLICRINPEVFNEDFELIRAIEMVKDPPLFQVEVDCFHERNLRHKGWLRGVFLIRVSSRRLLEIKRDLFDS